MKNLKKLLSLLLALALALALLPAVPASATYYDNEYSDGTFIVHVTGEEATLWGIEEGVSLTGCVTIPDTVCGYPVCRLSRNAITQQNGLTELILPSTVHTLLGSCIWGCGNLTRIRLPATLKNVTQNFINSCEKLRVICIDGPCDTLSFADFSEQVLIFADIHHSSPSYSGRLSRVCPLAEVHFDPWTAVEQTEGDFKFIIADGKATVTEAPMQGSVTIPETLGGAPVCYLLPMLFRNATIKTVRLPASIEELPYCCFVGSTVSTIDLKGIRRIGYGCFANDSALQELTISGVCEELGDGAFTCTGLSRIDLPSGVKTIGADAFRSITSCTQLTLPDTLTSLGQNAFLGTAVGDLTVPASLTVLPDGAFRGAVSGTLTLPDTLVEIGDNTFAQCKISAITLPESLRRIGKSAFYNARFTCPVEIPGTVKCIEERAFDCASFKDVTLCEGVEVLEAYAFNLAYFQSLSLPKSLTRIGPHGLGSAGWLEELTIPGDVTECDDAFTNEYGRILRLKTVYGVSPLVEADALEAGLRYVNLETGEEAAQPHETVLGGLRYKVLTNSAILLDGKSASGSIALPAEVEGKPLRKIAANAFLGNSEMTELTVPDNVTGLGQRAFQNCSTLRRAELGDGLLAIPDQCFKSCKALETVTVSNKLERIGSEAFSLCSALKVLALPDTVRTIGMEAFWSCSSLSCLRLTDNIESIGSYAFVYCDALRQIYLGTGFSDQMLYGMPGDVETIQPISDSQCLLYHPNTPAAEYVEKLNVWWSSLRFSYALPEGETVVVADDGVYRLDGDHATLLFCPMADEACAYVTLYDTVCGLPVTTVAENAFAYGDYSHPTLWIILSETVTTVEVNAFSGLANRSVCVLLPPSVTQIDPAAFDGLQQVTIYCIKDSAAEAFAIAHKLPFVYYELPFTDVAQGKWYFDAVSFVYYADLMHGVSETSFAPEATVTRAQLAQVLYNMNDTPDKDWAELWEYGFTDVPSNAWYARAVNWCRYAGLFFGVTKTEFAPQQPLTREQLVTVFCRYAEQLNLDVSTDGTQLAAFDDSGKVSNYAKAAMCWAIGNGIINGVSETTLAPQGTATRAQLATILMRFVNYIVDN